ncbi:MULTISPECIES: hypothetical protein [Pseudomonas syringae group]|uniref:Uncharacterized protein n=1 Tax=Pseudomonas syringae pv. persicae TaxID=237306 RepID=A0A3M4AWE7_9PSED|nr:MULTISPECIES: hypothetical protein [Pseudomonas syringae group]RMP10446.1 hypothetical protein ALQ30_200187 [Pseudomonas syringae pv. persicae]
MSQQNKFTNYDDAAVDRSASVFYRMPQLKPFMEDPDITEVCVNRSYARDLDFPGEYDVTAE